MSLNLLDRSLADGDWITLRSPVSIPGQVIPYDRQRGVVLHRPRLQGDSARRIERWAHDADTAAWQIMLDCGFEDDRLGAND